MSYVFIQDWLKANSKYSDLVPPVDEQQNQKYEYITTLMTGLVPCIYDSKPSLM